MINASHEELDSLLDLSRPRPDQLRRIAELVELLYDLETSRVWWHQAAHAGDRDAIDVLPHLDDPDEPMDMDEVRADLLKLLKGRRKK